MTHRAATLPTGSIIAGRDWTAIRVANPDNPNLPWNITPGAVRDHSDTTMQTNLDRGAVVLRIGEKTPAHLAELHTEFDKAWRFSGASSKDVVQLLDDRLVEQGFPTVLYA